MSDSERDSVPVRMRPYYDALISRTDAVCNDHLTEDYGQSVGGWPLHSAASAPRR